MSTPFNDQWALLGTHWASRARRGRGAKRGPEERDLTPPGHVHPGDRPTNVPERGARRHKRPRWIDRDT
jgi:hypothetical protein